MFLNRLKKKEKVVFLELAHHLARSDSDFSALQKEIIRGYCKEMNIPDIKYSEKNFSIKSSLNKIKTKESQKIILLEVMALIYSDDILHKEEKKILDKMIKEFNINQTLVEAYKQWSKSILALTIQGEALLHI